MKKIRKSIEAVGMIIRKPYLLNLILDENDHWKQVVGKSHPAFSQLPELTFSGLFGIFNETISPYSFLDGGSLPTDLALLKGLARQIPECSFFEIGTWRGESVANVSPVASECFTIDLPDEEKRKIGMSEVYIGQHALLSKHLPNVIHLKANSFHFDFSSLNRKFDLVFIDGDHHYASVLNDTRKVFAGLIHENSIVVWHDYAYNPEKIRFEVFAAILDGMDPTLHGNLFHVANTLCAVYFPKPLSLSSGYTDTFEIKLSIR